MNPGIFYAAAAFVCWGLFPLYFRQLAEVPATEVLVHRVVWSFVLMALVLAARRQWAWLMPSLREPRVLRAFAASALLLSINWITYIWSVTNGHVVEASLGYFITPLVNVLLGFVVLGERPRRVQWAALALAAAGVVWLGVEAGRPPWIALVLAASFGVYGLLRKIATLGAVEGLSLETLLLAPFAFAVLGWWSWQGTGHFAAPDLATNLWLIGVGPITAVPLMLFAAGARLVSMTTLGLLQYIGPTLQLALGVWLFAEPFGQGRLVGFLLIWAALLVYSADGWRMARQPRAELAAT
jgi:chloramphenicol-sensitive protein RarD